MPRTSAFEPIGLKETVEQLLVEAEALYLGDAVPWVIGYSGGKDSTAVLQLVWTMLDRLPAERRHKTVYVISTDTLVENPVVASWVDRSLVRMRAAAEVAQLPLEPHRLTPDVSSTFWVNLIGRGYPAPRHKFRWCTERLKIKPSNAFIKRVVRENGEAILVLGTRKAESSGRRHRMEKLEQGRVRDNLSPNDSLPNSLVYSPVEDWTNDDVWLYLMQMTNPWGHDNHDLLTMYRGASPDNECPLVVDGSTPSCGDSRFGCWVCTLVDKDKSMSAMIQNDEEKEWMLPLLQLRDKLDIADDRHLRDFRRMNGQVQLMNADPIPGPYTEEARHHWLTELLRAQRWITENGPAQMRDYELISLAELEEIRRLWVFEKHEIEDALPGIYQDTMGKPFPGRPHGGRSQFDREDLDVLKEVCGEDRLHYELVRELLDVEQQYATMVKRKGLLNDLERAFKRSFYDDREDAVTRARSMRDRRSGQRTGESVDADDLVLAAEDV